MTGRGGLRQRHSKWKGIAKKRCSYEKCNKRARDFIDGKPLCRIHSPMRKGYNSSLKEGKK